MQTGHKQTSVVFELHTELSTAWRMMLKQAVPVSHHTGVVRNIPPATDSGLQYAVFKAALAIAGKGPIA